MYDKYNKCIICGEHAPYGPQCTNCFYDSVDYKEDYYTNYSDFFELEKHYFNLKNWIIRTNDFEKVQEGCVKLFALNMLANELFDEEFPDLIKFVTEIIEKKESYDELENFFDCVDNPQVDKKQLALDGHIVKSKGEKIIDDILYTNGIIHAYSPIVPNINIYNDQTVEADFFVPILGLNKGVYIEYWGMNTHQYLLNKVRKQEVYKRARIPLIEIEMNEPLGNTSLLQIKLINEIRKLAKEFYNYDWNP